MVYDVFISCKSEDYPYAEEVYGFLKSQSLKVFLATKQLRESGSTEYFDEICKAIHSSKDMIILASKPEYFDSSWVRYEWQSFVIDKLNGRNASGQIMTILNGVDVKEINPALSGYESFTFESYQSKIMHYVRPCPVDSIKNETEKKEAKKTEATFTTTKSYLSKPVLTRLAQSMSNATEKMFNMVKDLNETQSLAFKEQVVANQQLLKSLQESSNILPDGLFNKVYQFAIDVPQNGFNWVISIIKEDVAKGVTSYNLDDLNRIHQALINDVVNLNEAQSRLNDLLNDIYKFMSWL